MKKLFALVLGVSLAVTALTGCAAPAAPQAPAATEAPAETAAPEDATAEAPATPEAPATMDDSLERVKSAGFFTVGLDDAFPPMGYRDENDQIVGFDIDIAKAVAAQMGIEVKFQPVVWANIAMEVENRNVDVIWNGCTITDERKQVFDFSMPYMLNKQVVVVLEGSDYQTLEDLTGKVIGIQDGSSANIALDNHPEFKNAVSSINGYDANDKALLDLAAKRLDAVVVDLCVFGHYIQQKPGVYRILDQDLGSEEFGVAFNKKDKSFLEAFNAALTVVINNGAGEEISQKWFQSSVFPK